jgi:hypothetical protein
MVAAVMLSGCYSLGGPTLQPPADTTAACDGYRNGYSNPANTTEQKAFIIDTMRKLNCTNIPQ